MVNKKGDASRKERRHDYYLDVYRVTTAMQGNRYSIPI